MTASSAALRGGLAAIAALAEMQPRERPILFSGPMVRATLEDRKTKTRRVVVPQPKAMGGTKYWHWRGGAALKRAGYGAIYVHTEWDAVARAMLACCPYGNAGDRLWVRENFSRSTIGDFPWYWADGNPSDGDYERPKPSIHMPRWASRITLELTEVRVERVQDISEVDAIAEGFVARPEVSDDPEVHRDAARDWYMDLWDSLNAKRGFGWDVNPFVWVLSFRRVTP